MLRYVMCGKAGVVQERGYEENGQRMGRDTARTCMFDDTAEKKMKMIA